MALENGHRVGRAGWNGKGMWLVLVPPSDYAVCVKPVDPIEDYLTAGIVECEEGAFELLPWIGMKTADNKFVPWLCSQTDALAKDWEIVR